MNKAPAFSVEWKLRSNGMAIQTSVLTHALSKNIKMLCML